MNDPRPITKQDAYERCWAMIKAVDERGRQVDERWGIGRLPTLVPLEWADRFAAQRVKFNRACFTDDVAEVRKHGDAMIRAYDKLEEIAAASGADQSPPDQWEFETPHGLVILVRDRNRMGLAQTLGRNCQVWSVDEIASVIEKHPTIIAVKDAFPGAELVAVRPDREALRHKQDRMDDEIPF